jgi:hypothetical protein
VEVGVWLQFAELMQEVRAQGLSKIIAEASLLRQQTRKACSGAGVFIGSFRGGMTGVCCRVCRCLSVTTSGNRLAIGGWLVFWLRRQGIESARLTSSRAIQQ